MGEFAPTKSQSEAMETRGRSILVSAGAGSGKTKVLTERLMKYILDRDNPESIDRFVIITFTKASAAELRSRITAELIRASAEAEKDTSLSADYRRHIRRQQALIGKAQIGTIHHFCSTILHENSHRVGLPPDYRIISDEQSDTMKADALSRVLDERYSDMKSYPGFENLVNTIGAGRSDASLTDLIGTMYEKMQSHTFPRKWAEECVAMLDGNYTDIGKTEWGREVLRNAKAVVSYWSWEFDRLIELARKDDGMKLNYLAGLEATAADLREYARCISKGWECAHSFAEVAFPNAGHKRTEYDETIKKTVTDRRDKCKKALGKIYQYLNADTSTLCDELNLTAPSMKALVEVTRAFEEAFEKGKLDAGLADYSDLEHKAADLLINPEYNLAPVISRRYREIMIDEYQDVSLVQDAIFAAVSDDRRNLFMVGDVKQAIYRFRLADPDIFNEKYRKYPLLSEAPGEGPVKILLRENFRSRREILDCANSVFSHCMSDELGDVDYNDEASLICGSTAYSGSVPVPELAIVQADSDGRTHEAEYVAARIQELVSSGEKKANGERIGYGDIAILLRNANKVGGVFRRELVRRGIPVMSGQGGGFFETREISLMLSLLNVLDNPRHDADLVYIMSSVLYAFSPDELAEIRVCCSGTDLWHAAEKALEPGSGCAEPLREKLRKFRDSISTLRAAAPDMTLEMLIRSIISTAGLADLLSAMPDGGQRCANLNRLVSLAVEFESGGNRGLHRFVRYLSQLREKDSDIPSSGGSASAVQIVSVHHSKGLEYPVVFLCDTSHKINKKDSKESVLIHPELGFGPSVVDTVRKVRYPSLAKHAIALRLDRETVSEEMRLLYVALTRPKERLIMTAYSKDPENTFEKWRHSVDPGTEKIEPVLLSGSDCWLGWLIAAGIADGFSHIKYKPVFPDSGPVQPEDAGSGQGTESPDAGTDVPEEIRAEVERMLEYRYPHENASQLPSKVTATELKHYGNNPDEESLNLVSGSRKRYFRRPDFTLEKKALSPTERGIATHLTLQFMDIAKGGTEEGVSGEIDRLREAGFLSERQASAVNTPAIVGLFASPLGKRIACSDNVRREFRFSLLCSAGELLGSDAGEDILLQGVVDCCIEEDGELVIIDYKTDNVRTDEQIADRARTYSGQLKAYALALGRILGRNVKEAVLYFLMAGKNVSVKL